MSLQGQLDQLVNPNDVTLADLSQSTAFVPCSLLQERQRDRDDVMACLQLQVASKAFKQRLREKLVHFRSHLLINHPEAFIIYRRKI